MSSKVDSKYSKKSNLRNDKKKRLRKMKESDSESDSDDIWDSETELSSYETVSETDSTYTPPKTKKVE